MEGGQGQSKRHVIKYPETAPWIAPLARSVTSPFPRASARLLRPHVIQILTRAIGAGLAADRAAIYQVVRGKGGDTMEQTASEAYVGDSESATQNEELRRAIGRLQRDLRERED